MNEEIRIEYMPLAAILKAIRNGKSHDLGLIHSSMNRFDFVEPIVLNETTGRLVAGHGRLETLFQKKASGERPPGRITERNGEWFVPVVRGVAFETDAEAEAYLIASNQTTIAGGWDETALLPMLTDLATLPDGLVGTGFDGDDVDRMLRELQNGTTAAGAPPPEPKTDDAAILEKKWGTKQGQLWQIGRHRLACGSCLTEIERLTEGATIDLVLTDPPYGIGVEYRSFQDTPDNLKPLIREFVTIARRFPVVLLTPGNRAMWDYPRPDWVLAWIHPAGMGCGPWGFTQFNAILAYGKDPYLARGLGSRPDSLVLAVDREGVDGHPTPKPAKLWSWLLERGSPERGQRVLDMFCGSGTTLAVCQQMDRIGYGVELDPGYCAVTLERLSEMGLKPELIDQGPAGNHGASEATNPAPAPSDAT